MSKAFPYVTAINKNQLFFEINEWRFEYKTAMVSNTIRIRCFCLIFKNSLIKILKRLGQFGILFLGSFCKLTLISI